MRHDNDNELPRTRAEARETGSKFYFTTKPCKHGHIDKRHTSSGQCGECRRVTQRASYPQRAVKSRAYQVEYRAKNRKKSRDATKKWREANPERATAKIRKWRATHQDRVIQYRQENRDLAALYARNRRSRIKGNGGTHTLDDVNVILVRQKYKCAECGKSVRKRTSRHVDHIMPIKLGGTNWPWNLQILCSTCNQEKWCIDPLEFARRKGRLV